MAKETAEQKLLKLIEATDGKPAAAAPAQATASAAAQTLQSVKSLGVPTFSLPPFINNLLGVFVPGAGRSSAGFGLREVNGILALMVAVIGTAFVLDFIGGFKRAQQDVDFPIEQKVVDTAETFLPVFPDLSAYVTAITQRNIFQPFQKKEPELETVNLSPGAQRIAEQTKDLKLVGISWLDTPESASVMIEHKVSGVTYFLRAGEQVNSIVIKAIFADSIVVTYQGEEMEIKL